MRDFNKWFDMDYKKKYNEALKRAKSFRTPDNKDVAVYIFPELAESEDERMMKIIMNALIKVPYSELDGLIPDTIRIWLEGKIKQGEQKSIEWIRELEEKLSNATPEQLAEWKEKYFKEELAEWSEDDQSSYNEICSLIYDNYRAEDASRLLTWLNELKDRVQPQPKQEWSKEDEKISSAIIKRLSGSDALSVGLQSAICWLKSLKDRVRPQNTWKPSATDIIVLEDVIDRGRNPINYHATLHSILEQLKKLREE